MYDRAILSMAVRNAPARRSPRPGCLFVGLADRVVRHDHRLLQAGVDDVLFVGAVNQQPAVVVGQPLAGE